MLAYMLDWILSFNHSVRFFRLDRYVTATTTVSELPAGMYEEDNYKTVIWISSILALLSATMLLWLACTTTTATADDVFDDAPTSYNITTASKSQESIVAKQGVQDVQEQLLLPRPLPLNIESSSSSLSSSLSSST